MDTRLELEEMAYKYGEKIHVDDSLLFIEFPNWLAAVHGIYIPANEREKFMLAWADFGEEFKDQHKDGKWMEPDL